MWQQDLFQAHERGEKQHREPRFFSITQFLLESLHTENNCQSLSKRSTAEQTLTNWTTFKEPSLKAGFVSAYPQYWQWTLVQPAGFPTAVLLFLTWCWALKHPSWGEAPSNYKTGGPRDPLHKMQTFLSNTFDHFFPLVCQLLHTWLMLYIKHSSKSVAVAWALGL